MISNLSRFFFQGNILLTFDFEQRLGSCVAYFVFGNTQKSATVLFSNSDDYGHYEEEEDDDDDDGDDDGDEYGYNYVSMGG